MYLCASKAKTNHTIKSHIQGCGKSNAANKSTSEIPASNRETVNPIFRSGLQNVWRRHHKIQAANARQKTAAHCRNSPSSINTAKAIGVHKKAAGQWRNGACVPSFR